MTNFWYSMLAQINYGNVNPCPLGGVSCVSANGADDYLRQFINGQQGLFNIFAGVLFGMLLFYGIKLLVGSRSDNIITEVRQAYGHAFFGAVIAGAAILLANTFALNQPGQIVAEGFFNDGTLNVINFVAGLTATLVLVNVVVQGIRLIVAPESGDMDKARTGFLHGVIGAGIAILALSIVRVFTSVNTAGGGGVPAGGMTVALTQIVGIGRYITLILGGMSVFGILIAGIMLVVSFDESLKDRARKLIIASVVALAVSLIAYGLVTLFIDTSSLSSPPPPANS